MNQTSRFITFIVLSSLVMMIAITLQNQFFPPKLPNVVAKGQPAEKMIDEPSAEGGEPSESVDNPAVPAAEEASPSEDSATDQAGDSAESSNLEGESEKGEQTDPVGVDSEAANVPPAAPIMSSAPENDPGSEEKTTPSQLVTLGSLDPNDPYRFLITLNTRGAAVRRIESASRGRNGRYLYRDLETDGGYLGNLDCVDSRDGCTVRVVGPGTPAAIAGLREGDLIRDVDGTPIVSAGDLQEFLTQTTRGQEIRIGVLRGSPQSREEIVVQLTERPLEFTRPETSLVTGEDLPESFLVSLFQTEKDEKWAEIDRTLKTGNWDVVQNEREGVAQIEFRRELSKDQLAAVGLAGPLTIYKRYWLDPLSDEELDDRNSRSWHLHFELEIECRAEEPVTVGYELDGPTGAPTEGWWYQMKINGSGSFTGLAGARDVVAESSTGRFSFLAGPSLVSTFEKPPIRQNRKDYTLFDPYRPAEERGVAYFGVDSQYFNVSILPEGNGDQPFVCYSGYGWPTDREFPDQKKLHKLVDCTGVLFKKVTLGPNQAYRQRFEVFSGPKEARLLAEYGMEDTRAFGWFGSFSKPLIGLLRILYTLTFQVTYAIPIIILTMIVRSLMIPISRKAAINAQMMQYLTPEIKAIKERYPDDMQAQASAQRELFKKYKYNPFSGCLMGLIQLPIFIGLYRGLSVDIALRDQPLIPGIPWCTNLAAPDQFLRWDSWMIGASETGWLGPYLNILPLITIALFVINAKMFTPPPTDEQQAMMQKMMTYMMFAMGFLFFKVPSALCLYFITSSIWGIAERKLLPKPELKTDQLEGKSESGFSRLRLRKQEATIDPEQDREDRKRRDKDRRKRLREKNS